MAKLLLGLLLILVSVGCDKAATVAEPTPETAPWLFPEKQIELLDDRDFIVRALAARNLGNIGARSESAIPELEKLLEDENPKVRKIAAEALEKIRAATGGAS